MLFIWLIYNYCRSKEVIEELPGSYPVISAFLDPIVKCDEQVRASAKCSGMSGPIREHIIIGPSPFPENMIVPVFPIYTLHSIVTLQTINKFPKESLLSHIVLFRRPYVAT